MLPYFPANGLFSCQLEKRADRHFERRRDIVQHDVFIRRVRIAARPQAQHTDGRIQ